jgi:EAL domain-containing protein (putative c-di-GMP-specific phosphodiesterase class I)
LPGARTIETIEALERLRDLGCTTAQGYLLSQPVPGPDLAAVINRVNESRHDTPKRKSATIC